MSPAFPPPEISTSLPSRGAWIEIVSEAGELTWTASRSPHGERGLKFPPLTLPGIPITSLPSRGAWIEIDFTAFEKWAMEVAPLTGSVD